MEWTGRVTLRSFMLSPNETPSAVELCGNLPCSLLQGLEAKLTQTYSISEDVCCQCVMASSSYV